MEDITAYTEIHCPECNASIKRYDSDGSEYYGCTNCNTYFREEADGVCHAIKTFEARHNSETALQIGDYGEIKDLKFLVTGIVYKYDPKERLYWTEYMLFNPAYSYYRVLANVSGEWYYIWLSEKQDFELRNTNVSQSWYVAIEQDPYRKYDHFTQYKYDILSATGEFDTDILTEAAGIIVDEYTDANGILVCETDSRTSIWFRGHRMNPSDVRAAFNKEFGSYFKETARDVYYRKWPGVSKIAAAITGLALITHLLLSFIVPEKILLDRDYILANDKVAANTIIPIQAGQIIVSGPAVLDINLRASIDNEWVDIEGSIINTSNGETYNFTKTMQYYSGVEGGEYWTEGRRESTVTLSSIPSGTYQLNLYPYTDSHKYPTLSVEVKQNIGLTSNLVLLIFLILLYPAYLYTRKYMYEEEMLF